MGTDCEPGDTEPSGTSNGTGSFPSAACPGAAAGSTRCPVSTRCSVSPFL
jgi:hypothetical protein